MKARSDRHPCFCGKECCADLVLSARSKDPHGVYIPQSRKVIKHMYLCEEHYLQMFELMEVYEEV